MEKAAPPSGDKLPGGACRPRSRLGGGRTRRPVLLYARSV